MQVKNSAQIIFYSPRVKLIQLEHLNFWFIANVVNKNRLQNIRVETVGNKTFLLSQEDRAGMSAVTADINVSVNHALDETQVRNKINMLYDKTNFGK